jgi:hypothetical protein
VSSEQSIKVGTICWRDLTVALQRNTAPELWRGGRQQPDSFLAKTA